MSGKFKIKCKKKNYFNKLFVVKYFGKNKSSASQSLHFFTATLSFQTKTSIFILIPGLENILPLTLPGLFADISVQRFYTS